MLKCKVSKEIMDSTKGSHDKEPKSLYLQKKRLQQKLIQKKKESENEINHSDSLPCPPDDLAEDQPIPTWRSSFSPCYQAQVLKSRC